MKPPKVITIDFETKGIETRPKYPPIPVGVSIKYPKDRKAKYYGWGHVIGNNCSQTDGYRIVKKAWSSGLPLLFQNAKFDVDVAETHCGCKKLPWEMVHDTLYLLFLLDPHAKSLGLKHSAERYLDMPPEEQDEVREWLVANGITHRTDRNWGSHICDAPGKLVGKYANGDVIRTYKLFNKLYPKVVSLGMKEAYDRERALMPIFLENERNGLNVDIDLLEKEIPVYDKAFESANRWIRKRLGNSDLNIDSNAELAEAFEKAGVFTDWVFTKTGKKSVSKDNMPLDKLKDQKLAAVFGYRNRLSTCVNMFMKPWLEKATLSGGTIHPNWNQVRQMKSTGTSKGTRTGRPSCDDPNLLNVSKSFYDRGDGYMHPKFLRVAELPLVRRYVTPDKGQVWGHRDYSQQELRILAHFEDGSLMEAYNKDPDLDVHAFVQDEIKRIMHREVDRVSTKTINFGRLYGQGLGALAKKLNTTVHEVKSIRNAQNKAIPGLTDIDQTLKQLAADGEPLITWGGRLYYCEPDKYVEKFNRVMSFEYKMLNYLVQGSAADATKEAIIRYNSIDKESRFLVTVYDEINISSPKRAKKKEMKILKDCMEGLEFDVPMKTDGKIGDRWGELKLYKD